MTSKYRFVLNASSLVMGGALQSCVSFIQKALVSQNDIDWWFIVSIEINEELKQFGIDIKSNQGFILEVSPARNKMSRLQLTDIIKSIGADAIFTFFGPAYVKFSIPHLMGVADGWITHSSYLALRTRKGAFAWPSFFLLFLYKRYWYKQADRWVVEAECARKGMARRFFIPKKKVSIVSNSCGDSYRANKNAARALSEKWRILTLSSYYRHKNLEIIPEVAAEIRRRSSNLKVEFVITIARNTSEEAMLLHRARILGVDDMLNNIGPVSVKDGPKLYRSCDIMFMPSLLETFSAVFPEAMMSCLPIVTTDLNFTRDICGNAAIYYSPTDADAAAEQIIMLIDNKDLCFEMVKRGKSRVSQLPDQSEKHQHYIKLLNTMLGETRGK